MAFEIAARLASIVAPPRCPACGRPSAVVPLCPFCERELASARTVAGPAPPGVDLAIAAASFDGVARRIVHGLKYGRRIALAAVAASAILKELPETECVGAVVPVPPAPVRWRWRGFDPAEEIAIAVAERGRLPFEPCLRRSGGPRQVGRRRRERLADPPRVRASRRVPQAALLVDDVWTTGATLSACARALRAAGCRRVVALAVARSKNPTDRLPGPNDARSIRARQPEGRRPR